MAFVDTFAATSRPGQQPPEAAPFGLNWWAAIVCSEFLFVLCRAGAQHSVNVDNPTVWLAGLAPFVIQYAIQRFSPWRSVTYIKIWMTSLVAYLAIQILGLVHFIEYPLFLRVDIGFGRSLASACIYVGLASLLLSAISFLLRKSRKSIASSAAAIALACGSLAVAVFQPY